MSAMEELQRLLDEQDVTYTMRYRLTNGPSEVATKFYVTDEDNRGYAIIDTECSVHGGVTLTVNATPKQAAEIVAGRGTCRMGRIEDEKRILHGWLECSECGPVYPPANERIQDAVKFCPFCGRKVVD